MFDIAELLQIGSSKTDTCVVANMCISLVCILRAPRSYDVRYEKTMTRLTLSMSSMMSLRSEWLN